MPLPIPTQVPVIEWTLLSGDVLTPFQGSINGVVIQAGVSPIRLLNNAFYMTYVLDLKVPAAVTVVLEVDNLLQYQEFTVIDGALNAGTFPITINFGGLLCNNIPQRVIASNGGSETYVWDGLQFRLKG